LGYHAAYSTFFENGAPAKKSLQELLAFWLIGEIISFQIRSNNLQVTRYFADALRRRFCRGVFPPTIPPYTQYQSNGHTVHAYEKIIYLIVFTVYI
jgi:hypothetical protein